MSFQPMVSRLQGVQPSTPVLHPAALPAAGGFAWCEGAFQERCGPVALLAALALAAGARQKVAVTAFGHAERIRSPGPRQWRPLLHRRVRHGAAALGGVRYLAPNRGLQDVEALRSLVKKDFLSVEACLRSRRPSRLERLLFGGLCTRAFEDLRLMRKTADADIDRLQLALLRGDPMLNFLRGAWLRARGVAPPPVDIRAELSEHPEAAVWLRGQVGQQDGLDPVVVASVVGRVKHDPNLVERLAAESMERQGRDAHASGLLAGLKEARRQKAQSWLLP